MVIGAIGSLVERNDVSQVLTPYAARRATSKLRLSPDYTRSLQVIVGLLADDGRANVQAIHDALFPLVATGSANKALRRLVERVNDAAASGAPTLEMCISSGKSEGASGRWVWFEGPDSAAPTPATGELDAIPTDRFLDQHGVDTTAQTAVLLTFNKNETRAVLDWFCPQGRPRSERRGGVEYNDLGDLGGFRVLHAVSRQGQRGAQSAAELALRAWNPDLTQIRE